MEKLSVSEIRYLNNHFGNGHFFSRKTMSFFGDRTSDFGTYLDKAGDTILYSKKRGSTWKFNKETNALDSYREVE
jgi:hypothetical protein